VIAPPLSALLLAVAAPTPPAHAAPSPAVSDQSLFHNCATLVQKDPNAAVTTANDWRLRGGGIFARQCLGLAYTALNRWPEAATAFEQAAHDAETSRDSRAADFWVQAGNSWLAGDQPGKARADFDSALATTALTAQLRGEVELDRARADVALDDLAAARADLDHGLQHVPDDPYAWYLSASLAVKEESLPRAQADIAKALERAPNDPDVLLEAGNIAGLSGNLDQARTYYARAVQVAPNSDAGKSARAALIDDTQPDPPANAAPANPPGSAPKH